MENNLATLTNNQNTTTTLAEEIQIIEKNIQNISRVSIKSEKLPNIETKVIVTRNTGNYINSFKKNITMPLEMIIYPFFTVDKKNKKVNITYSIPDIGMTIQSVLCIANSSDKVFQPSTFEEKIYMYLLMLYSEKKDNIDEKDEYIEFEVSSFIEGFLGIKMNRTYYSKITQALNNLKYTEYRVKISDTHVSRNQTFEDENFRLLDYQKLSKGRKIYYRILINKNIRNKIKEQRYVLFQAQELVKILEKDPVASRIYKYISAKRMKNNGGEQNIRSLASMIPLRTEQETERYDKDGQKKVYILSRINQVIKRIEKAFKVLQELGYISSFYMEKRDDKTKEGAYFVIYQFNTEKDGVCHVSSYISKNKSTKKQLASKDNINSIENKNIENSDIEEAEVIDSTPISLKATVTVERAKKQAKKTNEVIFSEITKEKIDKARKNRFVKKSWPVIEPVIVMTLIEKGEDIANQTLDILYKLKANVGETIRDFGEYTKGIVRNTIKKQEQQQEQPMMEQMSLFGSNTQNLPEENYNNNENSVKTIEKNKNEARKEEEKIEKEKIEREKESEDTTNEIENRFANMNDAEQQQIINDAMELYEKENGKNLFFLNRNYLDAIESPLFLGMLKPYIKKLIKK